MASCSDKLIGVIMSISALLLNVFLSLVNSNRRPIDRVGDPEVQSRIIRHFKQ